MILKRFYDELLAQASYMIGCQSTGEALVLDPGRDPEIYLQAARSEGLRITHVTETHIHADFVSGSRELAAAAGAQIYLSAEGGRDWQYGFAEADGAELLKDGDEIRIGEIRIRVMHTPGHTPEHLAFIVTDTAVADRPMGAVTGDFLFVGDVGRPDLLEKAAGLQGTMESGARDLFRSLQRFGKLEDWIQIWPGHGAGSACGKGLGAVPTSTLGYERLFNWAFSHDDEESFVKAVLEGQPDPPRYFAEMKRINRDGPRILGKAPPPPKLDPGSVGEWLADSEVVVVDTRLEAAFTGGHIPGTLNIPKNRSFTANAGWLLPYSKDLILIVDGEEAGVEVVRGLTSIGLDRIRGLLPTSAIAEWARSGHRLETVGRITPEELEDRRASEPVTLLDVRWQNEWDAGHIPGAIHVPMGYLEEGLSRIPETRPVVLACASGARSAVSAGVLQRLGVKEVINLEGGFNRWKAEGRPVDVEQPEG